MCLNLGIDISLAEPMAKPLNQQDATESHSILPYISEWYYLWAYCMMYGVSLSELYCRQFDHPKAEGVSSF